MIKVHQLFILCYIVLPHVVHFYGTNADDAQSNVLFLDESGSEMKRRMVITFFNSTLAQQNANAPLLQNTSVVKQYGRRLVLAVYDASITNEMLNEFYGGYDVVQAIEEDFIVIVNQESQNPDIMAFSNQDYTPSNQVSSGTNANAFADNIFQTSDNTIEWQFAADEPYGMQVEKLWPITNGSLETRIAVIDGGIAGIARSQSWFENLEQGYDFISDAGISLDGDGRDTNPEDPGDSGPQCPQPSWHGSRMAFAIAGKHNVIPGLHSVAWNTTIQPLRVLGVCSSGYANDVTDAIVWAAGGFINGMGTNPNPAQIISMSFGGIGKCPSYLQSAITMAINQYGVVIISAAGNSGSDEQNVFPANCIGVVSITASTRTGTLAMYSNRGKNISLSAPGGDPVNQISSFVLNGNMTTSTKYGMGTSFSTAFVSGFLGLEINIFNVYAEYKNVDKRYVLQKTSAWFNTGIDEFTHVMCGILFMCGSGIVSANTLIDKNNNISLNNLSLKYNSSSAYIDLASPLVFPVQMGIPNPTVESLATTVCTAGNYFTGTGTITASQCTACETGKYSTVIGSDSANNCVNCMQGNYYLYSDRSKPCDLACNLGSYYNMSWTSITHQVTGGSMNEYQDVPTYKTLQIMNANSTTGVTFNSDTHADVLIVGPGGAAPSSFGGGGGSGAIIFYPEFRFLKDRTYSLKVGFGGNISHPSTQNSQIYLNSEILFEAVAGGIGGGWSSCVEQNAKGNSGGSGGGGGTCMNENPIDPDLAGGDPSSNNIVNGIRNISLGYKGGKGYGKKNEWWQMSGGGGGAGMAGTNATGYYNPPGTGGDGIHSVNFKGMLSTLSSLYGTAYTTIAVLESDNKFWIGGGGGGGGRCGGTGISSGGKGGGGNGVRTCNWGESCDNAKNGKDNTGSGAGGGGQGGCQMKFGGNGLILIRYRTYQPACFPCIQGTFSNINATSCISCTQGYYANTTGSTSCLPCAAGTITTTESGFVNCVKVCVHSLVSLNLDKYIYNS